MLYILLGPVCPLCKYFFLVLFYLNKFYCRGLPRSVSVQKKKEFCLYFLFIGKEGSHYFWQIKNSLGQAKTCQSATLTFGIKCHVSIRAFQYPLLSKQTSDAGASPVRISHLTAVVACRPWLLKSRGMRQVH